MPKTTRHKTAITKTRKLLPTGYKKILTEITGLLESARRATARTVNLVMTATYWEVGRRIVESEQAGKRRAHYGERLLEQLSADLTAKFGRGFSIRNLSSFRSFYTTWSIRQTLSAESDRYISPQQSRLPGAPPVFPLPWSHYVRLLSVNDPAARQFYETEALRGGWSVRQLDRQINSMFYQRTALSRNKVAMLTKGVKTRPQDRMTAEEEIKDPFMLEFLGLKDEYSESEIEEALIRHLESFLLELGADFAFVGRQKRLRIGDQWFRVDLLFFHRRLRSLIIIDLKIGKFTHADAGQMHMYLNYASEHWTNPDENPPVGLILCDETNTAVAHYALEGLANKVLAAQYRTTLPDEKLLADEMKRTRRILESRRARRTGKSGSHSKET